MPEFVIDSSARIRLGARADAVERTAAEQLHAFLGRMLGTEVAHYGLMSVPDGVSHDGDTGKGSIILGTPASSQLVRMLAGTLGLLEVNYDGFVVAPHSSREGDFLVIASTEPKGVLNGVYRLLEEMGCDLVPMEPGLPSASGFTVVREIREEPRFAVRAMNGPIEYLARNRLNAVGYPSSMSMVYLEEFDRLRWRERFGDEIEAERGRFREFLARARDFGMRVFLSGVEHWWPDELVEAYPELAHPDTGHVFCPSRDNWLIFARSRLEELLRAFDGIWGYRLTLADICRESPFRKCPACRHIGNDERMGEIARELGEAAAASGTRLVVRTWGMDWKVEAFRETPWRAADDWDPVTSLFRLSEAAPKEVILESKNTWGEDVPAVPSNPWLSEFPDRERIASFDAVSGEYRGCNLLPCSAVDAMRERMIEIGAAEVRGVLDTGEVPGGEDLRLGERLGMLNAVAFSRLAWDPSISCDRIHRLWARAEFPDCDEEMARIMRATHEPVTKALMIRSQRANYHSGVPESLAELERCMLAYGFNDLGGKLEPAAISPTPKNADAAVREKNEAVAGLDRLLRSVRGLAGLMSPTDHSGLVLAFEFAREYAKLWRLVTEAWFLAGMISSGSEQAEQCRRRLANVCDGLVAAALALPDNSEMASPERLWCRDSCPALTRNIRRAVRKLVEEDLKPRAGAGSGRAAGVASAGGDAQPEGSAS